MDKSATFPRIGQVIHGLACRSRLLVVAYDPAREDRCLVWLLDRNVFYVYPGTWMRRCHAEADCGRT